MVPHKVSIVSPGSPTSWDQVFKYVRLQGALLIETTPVGVRLAMQYRVCMNATGLAVHLVPWDSPIIITHWEHFMSPYLNFINCSRIRRFFFLILHKVTVPELLQHTWALNLSSDQALRKWPYFHWLLGLLEAEKNKIIRQGNLILIPNCSRSQTAQGQ